MDKQMKTLLFFQWCLFSKTVTLCNCMDCSPQGSSVHGIFRARILQQVAISYTRGSSRPRDQTCVSLVSCIARWILYRCATWEALSFDERVLIFVKSNLLIFCNVNTRILGLQLRNLCLALGHKDFLLYFFQKFYSFRFYIQSKICLGLFFQCDVRHQSKFFGFFCSVHPILFQNNLLNRSTFSH